MTFIAGVVNLDYQSTPFIDNLATILITKIMTVYFNIR
jgi:hypothetical protein